MAVSNNGDVLMLEAPPPEQPSRPSWSIGAEIIDSLPYIDDDYGDPKVKEEVDRLVEDEMRRSSKKPTDFLKDLPPLPKSNFEGFSCCSSGEVLGFIQAISPVGEGIS
ncbi:Pre-mRNA-splicing factor SPF27 [Sarracenia purpurea var. burkii]